MVSTRREGWHKVFAFTTLRVITPLTRTWRKSIRKRIQSMESNDDQTTHIQHDRRDEAASFRRPAHGWLQGQRAGNRHRY